MAEKTPESQHVLADDRLGRLLMRLSVPAMVGMAVMGLYNIVDTIFIGRSVGAMGIAGIVIAFPIQTFVMAIGQMLGIGSASVISRSLGAGETPRARAAFGNMLLMMVIFALAGTAAGYIWLDPMLRLFGATETILPYAREYMEVLLAGTLLHVFAMAANNVIRAEGRARIAMFSMVIGAVLNIVLDPIFIFWLGWGLRGAAWATVIAKAAGTVYAIWFFRSDRTALSLSPRWWRPVRELQREITAVGSSSFVRSGASGMLALIMNHALAFHGGDIAIATFGVINRLLMFGLTPAIGLAQGLQPVLGFNYGAERLDKARRSVHLAAGSATATTLLVSLLMLAFPTAILSVFSRDQELLALGTPALRIIVAAFPLAGIQMVGTTLFQAIGRAKPALLLGMARQVLFLLPVVLVLPAWMGLDGIWIAFPVADILGATLATALVLPQLRRFRSGEA